MEVLALFVVVCFLHVPISASDEMEMSSVTQAWKKKKEMAHVGFLCLIDLFIKLSIYFYKNPDNTEVLQNPIFHKLFQ